MSNKYLALASLTLVLAALCCGCGVKTVPVSGKVVVDGVPAENIRVVFQADSSEANVNPVAIGMTDQNGEYKLELAKTKKNGAAPGNYVIFLSWQDPDADADPIEGVTEANECPYNMPSRANSGELRFTVPDKGTKEANFEFDSSEENYSAPVGI